jgi:hypothetical protein
MKKTKLTMRILALVFVVCWLITFLPYSSFAEKIPRRIASTARRSEIETPLKVTEVLSDGISVRLRFDQDTYEKIRPLRSVVFHDFVLETTRAVDLELEQFSVFNGDTKFVKGTLNGDEESSPPDVVLLRGKVTGDEESHVFLGLSPHGTNGMIQTEGTIYYISTDLSSLRNGWFEHVFICPEEAIPPPSAPPAICHTTRALRIGTPEKPLPPESIEQKSTMYIADAALDGTFSYYQLMGSSWDAAQAYLIELVGGSNDIYQRDLNSKLWLSYSRVWTSADPFTENDNIELEDFQDYWNDNMGHVDRDLAAKITNTYSGGISYVDALCNQDWAYSVMGLVNGSFPDPITPGTGWWDLYVVTHEWGHSFGSEHTHCYSPPIDSCWNTEGGCYSGTIKCRRGTIMSYCHTCDLTGSGNIDPNFHPIVISYILGELSGASCLDLARDLTYVDLSNTGDEDGTAAHPWNTVEEGVRGVIPSGTVLIAPGTYPENILVRENARFERNGASGVVTIGQ